MDTLTLYIDSNSLSPYALFAFVALKEKGLPFEIRRIDLAAGAQHDEAYRQLSVTGKVPTLQHGDFGLAESSAIIEYLDEAFPTPNYPALLPTPLTARARARQIQAWLRSDLGDLRSERSTEVIFRTPVSTPLSDKGRAQASKLIRIATQLLEGHDTLFGNWCIADTELAFMLNRLVANGDAVPVPLARYVAREWSRASVQAWLTQ